LNAVSSIALNSVNLLLLSPLLLVLLGVVVLIAQDIALRPAGGRAGGIGLAAAARTTLVTAVLAGLSAVLIWTWIGVRNSTGMPGAPAASATGLSRLLAAPVPADQPIGLTPAGSAADLFIAVGPGAGNRADQVSGWWGGAVRIDYFGLFVTVAVCIILVLVTLNLLPHLAQHKLYRPELFPLLLMSALGMMLLGFSRDLVLTFASIELLSLPLYVLCGLSQRDPLGRESSLKYFLLGAFASGFFIYGSALVYGCTTHLNYSAIAQTLSNLPVEGTRLAAVGIALVGVGFAFKLALVPFHAWVPDVYQGAPTPITGFMASGVKLAVAAAFIRFLIEAVHPLPREYWQGALIVFAALSMLVGNLFALHQMSAKRLLAYSAIAHTGYLGVALAAASKASSESLLFYLLAYALAALGAFVLISHLAPAGQDDVFLDQLHELYQRSPYVCLGLAILLLSLGGFPLTAGFIGKLVVFRDAWREGLSWLVIFALVNSVLSFYYYLRFVMAMYMQPKVPGAVAVEPRPLPLPYKWAVGTAVALTLLFGVLPGKLLASAARCGLGTATSTAALPEGIQGSQGGDAGD
jgi:NADH-quinone oxidoreductase subunit N